MDLLDRYIRLLRLFLPRRERDDIARELSEEIHDELVDREAILGHKLTVEQQAEVIRGYGHPLVTAARYRPPQYLIGPLVFPYYSLAMKCVLTLMLSGHIIALAILATNEASWSRLTEVLERGAQNVLAVVAWLTVLAAVADRLLARTKVLERWDPRRLMYNPPSGSRAPTIFGWVLGVVISLWWLLALRYPALMFGTAADIAWGPDMNRLYPVLVVNVALFIIAGMLKNVWPGGGWLLGIVNWLGRLLDTLFVLTIASANSQWVMSPSSTVVNTVTIGGGSVVLLDLVNLAFTAAFAAAALVTSLSMIRTMFRWMARSRQHGIAAGRA